MGIHILINIIEAKKLIGTLIKILESPRPLKTESMRESKSHTLQLALKITPPFKANNHNNLTPASSVCPFDHTHSPPRQHVFFLYASLVVMSIEVPWENHTLKTSL